MNLIPWRIRHFFNKHLHPVYMLITYGTTNLNTREHWDQRFFSGTYQENMDTKKVFDKIIDLVDPGQRVLEIGCATGYLLKRLREEKRARVCGMDISPVVIENLRRTGIPGRCACLPEIPFEDQTFDAVVAKAVLEHLKHPDKSLSSMVRVLKPGGTLIISVPDNILGPEDEPEHFRKYSRESLVRQISGYATVQEVYSIQDCLLAKGVKL